MNLRLNQMLDQYQVTDETRQFLQQGYQQMFINGNFCDASDGQVIEIEDPSTGEIILTVPQATTADMDLAIASANQAFSSGAWPSLKPIEREAMLMKLADLMDEHSQTLAELEAIDAGKAISGCLPVDVEGAIGFLRYMAGWATKIEGATRNISWPGETFGYTLKEPIGVVGAIVPWNWPLNMSMWKMAAPLTVGCTLVLKPAELTPMSMLYFCKLVKLAGIPDGVINIVTGTGANAGAHLAGHPDIQKVSFTGSTPIGKLVGQAALTQVNPATLELGGKSAMIAFEDANINAIVDACHGSIFFNSGQVCSAGSRLYVHESIYQQTLDALKQSLDNVIIGDPLDPTTTQGPQISQKQFDSVMGYINKGKQEGATLIAGGKTVDRPGYYIEPTIFADTHNRMTIVQEEIFGPVLCVQKFSSEEEAIKLANDSIYGLAGSVFTQDLSRAHRVVKKLQAGSISVNTHDAVDYALPFGGYKQSGIGKDMGPEQLEHFLLTKSVIIQL